MFIDHISYKLEVNKEYKKYERQSSLGKQG